MIARRTLLLQTVIVAAVLVVACVAVLLVLSQRKAEAAFPGANGRIVYSARGCCEGNSTSFWIDQIFTSKPDGTAEKQLTHNQYSNVEASFSPDGRKIVWVKEGEDIWLMNANGTNKERLTSGPTGDYQPSFSPNGRKVVFVRYDPRDDSQDLYIKSLHGGGLRQLTNDRAAEGRPIFRPGGGRIAFIRSERSPDCNCGVGAADIATVRRDGTDLRVIPVAGSSNDAAPTWLDWSPDGRTLLFPLYNFSTEVANIQTIEADGTGQHTVFTPDPHLDVSAPVFSPDGKKIAFRYTIGFDIWTINTDGSGLSNVTNTPVSERWETMPDWQPKPLSGN
jgi:Tol biopolymer transport system component